MALSQGLDCPFEEDVLICGCKTILRKKQLGFIRGRHKKHFRTYSKQTMVDQSVPVVPVDLKLTVGIFMICLIHPEVAGIQGLHLRPKRSEDESGDDERILLLGWRPSLLGWRPP